MLKRARNSVGQWITIAACAIYAGVAWVAAEIVGPFLGYELIIGMVLFAGVFAVRGAQKLGEWAEWNLRTSR